MTERREPSKDGISHLAYALYLQRGCEPGKDIEDWVRAENELSREVGVGTVKTKAAQAGSN
jgi:hypothetical protein